MDPGDDFCQTHMKPRKRARSDASGPGYLAKRSRLSRHSLPRSGPDHAQSKSFGTDSALDHWLDTIFGSPIDASLPGAPALTSPPAVEHGRLKRSRSCPAESDLASDSNTPDFLQSRYKQAQLTEEALGLISQQPLYNDAPTSNSGTSKPASSQKKKAPSPADAEYIDTLTGHGIIWDLTGRMLHEELQPLKNQILRRRSSPPLKREQILKVMDVAEALATSPEGPTNKMLRTDMFPLEYRGLAEGGGTQWNTAALPNNLDYTNKLSQPAPDAHLGFPRGYKMPWTAKQSNVVNHVRVRPYTQPARGNTFPAIIIELQSESAGGTLTTAEFRAAGSTAQSVKSEVWLFEQAKEAGLADVDLLHDTVVFGIVASHREAIAYLAWRHPETEKIYLSFIKSFSSLDESTIQGCHDALKNMIDHVRGPKERRIGEALTALLARDGALYNETASSRTSSPVLARAYHVEDSRVQLYLRTACSAHD